MRVVVTGNMGCGKSTAVNVMMDMLPHYKLYDFDHDVQQMYHHRRTSRKICEAFGLDRNSGSSLKAVVSDLVHVNPEAMILLRSITDQYLIDSLDHGFSRPDVILDIPLYFEFVEQYHVAPAVICIATDNVDKQYDRVRTRSRFSDEKIAAVLAKQLPQSEKIQRSDFVLYNDFDTKEQFEQYVQEFMTTQIKNGVF